MYPYAGRNAPITKSHRLEHRLGVSPGFPPIGKGLGGHPRDKRLDQDSPDMILIVDTSLPGASQTATLPLAGTVNCTVDWGDNVQEAFTTTGNKTHVYAAVGEYTIRISGTLTEFGGAVSRPEYKRLVAPGRRPFRTSWYFGFRSCSNMSGGFPTRLVDANVTTIRGMFVAVPDDNLDTSKWDTSNVTDMTSLFESSNARPDTSQWNTEKVTSMAGAFQATTLANPDTARFDTGNVSSISSMFILSSNARPDTSQWNTGKMIAMSNAFQAAPRANPDMSRWVLNTGLTTMVQMLASSGISVLNYSRALVRFANQVFLNNGPYNVPLGSSAKYDNAVHADITGQFDNAYSARSFLAGAFAVTISGATDTDANGVYTGATLTNAAGWTLTFLTDTWTLTDDGATAQASGTGNSRSPASVTTWTGTESGITVAQTGAGWTLTDAGAVDGGQIVEYSSGGTDYRAHIFTTSGDFVANEPLEVEYLVVAGGGGGGGGSTQPGGGGGAGGLLTNVGGVKLALAASTYSVVIGAGGAAAVAVAARGGTGNNSTALELSATGGGGGGGLNAVGFNGGSGGGGSASSANATPIAGGTGVVGQGNEGGNGTGNDGSLSGGGGGGAGAVGAAGVVGVAGNGGIGVANSITGTNTWYSGGGGGAGATSSGTGGQGGGGAGGYAGNGIDGSPNTGGGGGAKRVTGSSSGTGGSGIVVIRYARSA
jgi:hypothetical protein